ncbi:MAG: hypothetical protein ACTILK_06315 [Bifidobacterium crudilactis]|uniref:hypothetical protein n=1 Tax=Bifidobacterium crudilactis TaxID=327277 RepID=UPI003F9E2D88
MNTIDQATSAISEPLKDAFKAEVQKAMSESNSVVRDLLVSNLESSVADAPELLDIFRMETAPLQAVANFHVVEKNAEKHTARAKAVAEFIESMCRTTNEQIKAKLHLERRSPSLLVAGFAMGSLDIILKAPEETVKNKDDHNAVQGTVASTESSSTVESAALKTIVAIFNTASLEKVDQTLAEMDDPLTAHLAALPDKARFALAKAAKTAYEANWDIRGELTKRHELPISIKLSVDGAERLHHALDAIPEQPTREILVGTIDGFRRSENVFFLKITSDRSALQIAVDDSELLQKVAAYSPELDKLFKVETDTYNKVDRLGNVRSSSRQLVSIEPVKSLKQGVLDDTGL